MPRSTGRRRLPAPLLLVALAGAAAMPPAAQGADEQFCYGKVTPIEATAERDTGAAYEFSCKLPIKGYAVTTTAPLSSFDVAADVFDGAAAGGALRGDDRFNECEGELPGLGFTCSGTYFAQGRIVRATFDGMQSPCLRDASRHVAMATSLVVVAPSGKLSGPFNLGRTSGCPKPPKKAAKAKSRKRARR